MPFIVEDAWIASMATSHDLSELSGCSVAIDASYYLKYLLDHAPAHEPLLPALGGLTGIADHIDQALDCWKDANIIPFFIFDGQPVAGQTETEVQHGIAEHVRLNAAWELYSSQQAQSAVSAFGATSAFNVKDLYPLLMTNLRRRELHFLVAPYNASAQLAHFDIIDSDQCAAIMGSQELLLYPIQETYISAIDFHSKKATVISKPLVTQRLSVTNAVFVDALLLTGTSFLSRFPVLKDPSVMPRPMPGGHLIQDAVTMLRTSSKSVEHLCNSYSECLNNNDPKWYTKYQRARMAVNHFVYIAESGQVQVSNYDDLTEDNREYLGLQIPAEVFHYINKGLISARTVDWILYKNMMSMPNATGIVQDDYKRLLVQDLLPLREQVIAVVLEKLNRGFQFTPFEVRVWFDPLFLHKYTVDYNNSPIGKVDQFTIIDDIQTKVAAPMDCSAPLAYELISLLNEKFSGYTFVESEKPGEQKTPTPLKDAKTIRTLVLLRFLYLRGYIGDNHQLDRHWGTAIVMAYFKLVSELGPDIPHSLGLFEAVFMAFELIRYGHFDAQIKYENLQGTPANGTDEDKTSVLLICRCASLLNLRHQINGYTGPLNKNLLGFSTLVSEIRSANRSLVEALTLALFLKAQAVRVRDDLLAISQDLPFLHHPNVGMGIAMKTFLDDTTVEATVEERSKHIDGVTEKWIPFATHIHEDIAMVYKLVDAINQCLSSMSEVVPEEVRERWQAANKYLQARPIQ